MDDHQLIERICRADEQALATLFDLEAGRLFAMALSILGNPNDAEEVVNDVLTTVWLQAERFDAERGTVSTWLSIMTRSRCLDRLRRNRRHRSSSLHPDAVAYDVQGDQSGEVERHQRFDLREATRAAMQRLSVMQRRVVRLAFFRDMSHREIAERLQMPLGTVKSHCRRGMALLRRSLSAYDPAR
jgi:RNA polymerase sigma-70 factor, ECF subfamily